MLPRVGELSCCIPGGHLHNFNLLKLVEDLLDGSFDTGVDHCEGLGTVHNFNVYCEGYSLQRLMGNSECGHVRRHSSLEIEEPQQKRRLADPIRIEEVEDDGVEPELTTLRSADRFIELVFKPSQKKKRTQRQMEGFIDDLIERGRQSSKELESKRKEKFLSERPVPSTKNLNFNLDKFLLKQQEFLEKKNISLERNKETLFASRTMEETHHPKINENSRRIAIQVSSRNTTNKKLIKLKNPRRGNNHTEESLQHPPTNTRKRKVRQSNRSRSSSQKNLHLNKKVNDSYLQQKLKREFEVASLKLGVGDKVNYLEFTEVLKMMSFASQEAMERAMLLEAWNLLAGSRITIERGLILSFVLGLFGIEMPVTENFMTESVVRDSPTKLKQDLDCTFLTAGNERQSTQHHANRLNSSLVQYIQHSYRPLCYNKMHEAKSSSKTFEPLSKLKSKQTENSSTRQPNRNTQNLSATYKNRIIDKASRMHILQPKLFNKDLSMYEMGRLKKAIVDKEIYQSQVVKQLQEMKECTFQPQINPSNASRGRKVFDMLYSDSKPKNTEQSLDKYSLEKTMSRQKQYPILQIEVNVGSRNQKILVFEGDDTDQLARDFLSRNSLSLDYKERLLEMIEQGLSKA